MDFLQIIIPPFIAGLFTFLAPCTLPLVPGYLSFISGVSAEELKDQKKLKNVRLRVFFNGLLYVIGFSLVFMLLGSGFAFGSSQLGISRIWLARIGGAFIIFFGLYLTGIIRFSFLNFLSMERQIPAIKYFKPGNPASSFIFGATFALGWTPCVGPVLGSVLALSATSETVGRGALLLGVFSAGLAIPFLLIALGIGSASRYLARITPYLTIVSIIGGLFLIFVGILLLTNNLVFWVSYSYRLFNFINYNRILDFL